MEKKNLLEKKIIEFKLFLLIIVADAFKHSLSYKTFKQISLVLICFPPITSCFFLLLRESIFT